VEVERAQSVEGLVEVNRQSNKGIVEVNREALGSLPKGKGEREGLLNYDNNTAPSTTDKTADNGNSTPFWKTRKFLIGAIIGAVLLVVVITVAIVISASGGSSGSGCVKSRDHFCKCSGTEMPIIIEGDSVVFNRKAFSTSEIGRLKTTNANNNVTTYSIFE